MAAHSRRIEPHTESNLMIPAWAKRWFSRDTEVLEPTRVALHKAVTQNHLMVKETVKVKKDLDTAAERQLEVASEALKIARRGIIR